MKRSTATTAGIAILATLAALALAGVAFIYSGAYDVAATEGHTGLTRWVLNTTQNRSVAVRADDLPDPPATDSAMVAHGFEHFRAMCVVCHGAPGIDRGELGQGITPTPPELSERAGAFTSRELFWIVKHGIKLAGMPGFGPTHSDEELWGIVAFLETLDGMTADEYQAWEDRFAPASEGEGGDGGHSHAPGTPAHGH